MRLLSCPPELKILVADMLSAYDRYKQAHESLFSAMTAEDIQRFSSDTVENYIENRLSWQELTHYKEKGVILGTHPIFARLRRIDEIRAMKNADLVHLKIRLENNLVRNRSRLRKFPEHPNTLMRKELIAKQELELAEVNRLLNY